MIPMPSFLPARAARWCGALLLAATAGVAEVGEVFKIDFGPASSCAPGYLADDGGNTALG